jgi:hypothetical protein
MFEAESEYGKCEAHQSPDQRPIKAADIRIFEE